MLWLYVRYFKKHKPLWGLRIGQGGGGAVRADGSPGQAGGGGGGGAVRADGSSDMPGKGHRPVRADGSSGQAGRGQGCEG